MSVTGIVAALTAEARTLGPLPAHSGAAGAPRINSLPNGSLLLISGMGPQAAARAAQALLAVGATRLLSFGLAGALDPLLRAGAVVLPHSITNGAGGVQTAYGPWRERLAAQAGRLPEARGMVGGIMLSVAQPLTTVESKSQARASTGACAVDMESFAIAEVAAQTGVNFAVARVVIDSAADALPLSVMQATGPYGSVNLPQLLAGLLGAPADWPAVLRLPQRYWAARRALRGLAQLDLAPP